MAICEHPECTGHHSSSHQPREEVCPSVRFQPTREISCAECGNSFRVQGKASSGRRFCSPMCRSAYHNSIERLAARPSSQAYTCDQCGKEFRARRCKDQNPPRFCSRACQQPGTFKGVKGHENKAAVTGVKSEVPRESGRLQVLERDGWTCGICSEAIDPGVKWDPSVYQPEYGVIDHKVPMLLGGANTWDNVQAAHFGCNQRKGTRKTDD